MEQADEPASVLAVPRLGLTVHHVRDGRRRVVCHAPSMAESGPGCFRSPVSTRACWGWPGETGDHSQDTGADLQRLGCSIEGWAPRVDAFAESDLKA